MILKLKNDKRIELVWSFLIMQYLEEYEGGLKKLKYDMEHKKNMLKITSLCIYAAVRANYDDEVLTIAEAVRLVDMKDVNKIFDFFKANLEEQEEFKKKQANYIHRHKKKKK